SSSDISKGGLVSRATYAPGGFEMSTRYTSQACRRTVVQIGERKKRDEAPFGDTCSFDDICTSGCSMTMHPVCGSGSGAPINFT
ncbi:hypothetical protein A2U01_0035705, partial [Trifolium medium]|nr:hypothetical protein [Trifolium medium]